MKRILSIIVALITGPILALAAALAKRTSIACPMQVGVVPIRVEHNAYAEEVVKALEEEDIRVEVDYADKNMNEKVKAYKTMKDPYILVLGDKEAATRTVSVTVRGSKQQLHDIPLDTFVKVCKKLNRSRAIDLIAEM